MAQVFERTNLFRNRHGYSCPPLIEHALIAYPDSCSVYARLHTLTRDGLRIAGGLFKVEATFEENSMPDAIYHCGQDSQAECLKITATLIFGGR